MAADFPSSIANINRPTAGTKRNAPGYEGHALHAKLADEIEAIEGVIGVTGSTVPTSLEYRLADVQAVAAGAAPLRSAGAVSVSGKISASAFLSQLADSGTSVAIQVLGDSTGDSDTEWPYLVGQRLAQDYPSWTVRQITFDDATQQFGAPQIIQNGLAGERFMDAATGTNGRSLSVAQSPYLSGVIDLRIKLRMSSWVPAAQNNVCGKSGNTGARGWYAFINTAGYPQIAFSTDGTNLLSMNSNGATGFSANADGWVRWLFTPDDGAGNRVFKAYKSTDGITWTQIGTTATTAGAVTLFNNSSTRMECGSIQSALAPQMTRLYEIQLRSGDGGALVAPALPELWPPRDANACQFAGAPILTIVNASVAGKGITGGADYLANATRLPKLLPNYGQALCFLSTSHNDGYEYGKEYSSVYVAWVQSIKALLPNVPLCALTQNPETSASTWYREHARRRFDILEVASALGFAAIDTYGFFTDNTTWQADYMADSAHPNAAGQAVWADEVYRFLTAPINK